MVVFDRDSLKDRLEGVSHHCRVLFALSCAERLFPLYELFSERTSYGDSTCLRSTLDHLWESVLRGQTGSKEPFLNDYESLVPGEDSEYTPFNAIAENAVAALTYACRCQQTGDTASAVWTAVQGYEAVDYIANTLEGIDYRTPEGEALILKKEYVQAEIQRQLRDIAELEEVARDVVALERIVTTFRNRAKCEGMALVPIVSALSK